MNQHNSAQKLFVCPMHPEVHQPTPGKCPTCGMDLVPEGARFGMLRHMLSNPVMVMVMVALMVAVMAGIMMMRQ